MKCVVRPRFIHLMLSCALVFLTTGCRPTILGTESDTPASGVTATTAKTNSAKIEINTEAESAESTNDLVDVTALTSEEKIVTLANQGDVVAQNLQLTVTSPYFSITAIDCPIQLPPGSSCQATVKFTSPGKGAFLTQLNAAFTYQHWSGLSISDTSSTSLTATGAVVAVSVDPLYSRAARWNEYVKNDGADWYSATNTACDGTETGNYFTSCVHGGEKLKVVATGMSTCENLELTENLALFDWECKVINGNATFLTRGLKSEFGLADLIAQSGTTSGFRQNYVTVSRAGIPLFQSAETKWWTNIVKPLSSSSLSSPRTIYTVNGAQTASKLNITANNVALVVLSGGTLSSTAQTQSYFLTVSGRKFTWIEGNFSDNYTDGTAFFAENTSFLRLQRANFSNFQSYLSLAHSNGKTLIDRVAISDAGAYQPALYVFDGSRDLIVRNFRATGTRSCVLDKGTRSTFQNLHCIGNDSTMCYPAIQAGGTQSIYNQVWFTNTGTNGFAGMTGADPISGATILGVNSHRNRVHGGCHGGRVFTNLDHSTAFHVVSTYNYYELIEDSIAGTGNNQYGQLVGDRIWGALLNSNQSSNNTFLNYVLKGQIDNGWAGVPCPLGTGTNAGFTTSCQPQGSSDFTLIENIDTANSFVGQLSVDDARNTTNNAGGTAFSSAIDLLNFESFYRSWGKLMGTIQANGYELDWGNFKCETGKTCSIWDWRLRADDTVLRNRSGNGVTENESFVSGEACPSAVDGNKTITDTHGRTFLINAYEIIGDDDGNDNSLCESGETCIYMPNIGSYQGEGDLLDACTFQDGTITGVTMKAYSINGI